MQRLSKNHGRQLKILITGANGLIGRLISKYLKDKGHIIYGIDKLTEGAITPRFTLEKNEQSEILKKPYSGKYFVADITNLDELRKVINAIGSIDIVIHLAAVIEKATPEIIKAVNEGGTENIFRLCEEYHIENVLLASSMMVLWRKYSLEYPFYLIKNNTYRGQDFQKITENESFYSCPTGEDISVAAYKNSKIVSEEIAKKYLFKGISSICMRVGSVNTLNKPPKDHTWAYTHHDDLCNFVDLAVQYLLYTNRVAAESIPLFLCSENKLCIVSLQKAKDVIGYVPKYGTDKLPLSAWRLNPQKSVVIEVKPSDQLRSKL